MMRRSHQGTFHVRKWKIECPWEGEEEGDVEAAPTAAASSTDALQTSQPIQMTTLNSGISKLLALRLVYGTCLNALQKDQHVRLKVYSVFRTTVVVAVLWQNPHVPKIVSSQLYRAQLVPRYIRLFWGVNLVLSRTLQQPDNEDLKNLRQLLRHIKGATHYKVALHQKLITMSKDTSKFTLSQVIGANHWAGCNTTL
eukprot:5099763-Amphidinium_carterae.1